MGKTAARPRHLVLNLAGVTRARPRTCRSAPHERSPRWVRQAPGLLAAPDILGTSQEIAEKLYADTAFREPEVDW